MNEREQIDRDFGTLQALLEVTPLATEKGPTRIASAREFMWMHEKRVKGEGRLVGFKHKDSRNYVFVLWPVMPDGKLDDAAELEVPKGIEAFRRGTFDSFEFPEIRRQQ